MTAAIIGDGDELYWGCPYDTEMFFFSILQQIALSCATHPTRAHAARIVFV